MYSAERVCACVRQKYTHAERGTMSTEEGHKV